MADKFFHEFPTATTLKDTSILLLDQDNQTTAVTLDQLKSFFIPTGSVLMFAASGVPTGWLECNGSVLPINNYTKLHNVIGQNYKTISTLNTLSSFQIPDLRGEFVRGWDNKKGVDSGRQIGSSQNGTGIRYLIDQYVGGASYPLGTFAINMGEIDGRTSGYPTQTFTVGSDTTFYQAQNTIAKSGNGDNNMAIVRPRNVALVYCIKT